MGRIIFFVFCVLTCLTGQSQNSNKSIYSYQIKTINDSVVNLKSFSGKKILFVNTASNSPFASQYSDLEKLYEQNIDSLIIIAFPCNDFFNEPSVTSSIQKSIIAKYNIHFIVAQKISVTGSSQNLVYSWLTQSSLNGIMSNPVQSDFFKFLTDRSGNLEAVFSSTELPLGDQLINAIKD